MNITLPPEQFFWALLDASIASNRRVSRQQLGYLFESILPLTLEEVHATYQRVPERQSVFVGCAMSRIELARQIESTSEPLLLLHSQSLPEFITDKIGSQAFPIHRLNLLVDEYLPSAIRTAKRLFWTQLTIMLVLCAGLLMIGLERRKRAGLASIHSICKGECAMNLRHAGVAVMFVAIVVLPVAVSARRCFNARQVSDSSEMRLKQSTHDIQEILDLRGSTQRIGSRERPTQDVIAQVNDVLAGIGVPTERLKSLSPNSDGTVNGSESSNTSVQYRRQSVRLSLEALTVTEVGAFLKSWSQSQQEWVPARIELVHARNFEKMGTNSYDLTILLSALYVAEKTH